MNYRSCLWLSLVFLLLVSPFAVFQASADEGFLPKWKVGDRWAIEAIYRDMKTPGEPWLPPIRWIFHVRTMKNIHRQDCYVLHIYPEDRSIRMQAILFVSSIDFRLIKIIEISPTPLGVKSREKEVDPFHPEPLLSQDTLVPYDLPVFPLVRRTIQQRDSFGVYQDPEPKSFPKIKTLGDLKFKKVVKQAEKTPDKQHLDGFSAYRTGGEVFQVEIFDSNSRQMLTQIWQEGTPWALSAETYSRKVRFIPLKNSSKPSSGGGQ